MAGQGNKRSLLVQWENSRVLGSIKKGFVMIIPILMAGAFALVVRNFPIPAFQRFLESAMGGILATFLNGIYTATFGFMALHLLVTVSYQYACALDDGDTQLQLMAVLTSVGGFIASFGGTLTENDISFFGAIGIFTAVCISVISTRIFVFWCHRTRIRSRLYSGGVDNMLQGVLARILPMAGTISIFCVLCIVIKAVFGANSINDLIAKASCMPFEGMGANLGSSLLYVGLSQFFWFFGIHGSNMLENVSQTIFVPALAVNETLVASGMAPTEIFSKTTLDVFVLMGGCGTAVSLMAGLLIFSKLKSKRQLIKSAAIPLVFNINEVLIFGLPVAYNTILFIPFVFTPLVMTLLSYGAFRLGLVPLAIHEVTWTTPIIISGYLATGSVAGSLLQVFNITVGVAIYAPFIRYLEKMQLKQEDKEIGRMVQLVMDAQEKGETCVLLNRRDELGHTAKQMMAALQQDIAQNRLDMMYQPQVSRDNRVVGAEALLRWRYKGDQPVYPPLVLSLAREDGCLRDLSKTIVRRVCEDMAQMRRSAVHPLRISVNITAQQLGEEAFLQNIITALDANGIPHSLMELEITEDMILLQNREVEDMVGFLKAQDIELAIDDFSMGHTSLKYLQNNTFRYVKLDGNLVRHMDDNYRSREIIRSIISLGDTLGFRVVAEYVETQRQADTLRGFGCELFQGFLYSPAVPWQELLAYVEKFEAGHGVDKG